MSTTVERKDFASSKRLRDVMGQYFTALDRGPAEGKKTAWCTSVGPAELLLSLGYNVYFPENHGAMLGASRMATDLIPLANARGFSPDICSYLTSDVGSYLKGESPLQKMKLSGPPKADVLVYNTNQCRDVKDWFNFYAREWNVPCLGIQTPRSNDVVDGSLVEYVASQIVGLVEPLEQVAGCKFDIDRLREIVDLSRQTTMLWKAVLEAAASVPAPITFFDGTIQMGPAVVLRGQQVAIDYYKLLVAELQERVAQGVAAVEGERLRIYWEGMPIWGKLSPLSNLFLNAHAAVVASTYCNSWVFEALDPADPFRSMARAYSSIFICSSDDQKQAYIERMVGLYNVDGILYHDSKTCANNSNNRYGLPQRIQEKLGLPFLVINGDLNDLRMYSEEQTRTNIEAFVEQLLQSARRMKYYCGIDIGASAAKLAILDAEGQMVAKASRRSGIDYAQTACRCLEEALAAAGLTESQVCRTVSTGYGRDNVPNIAGKMTEIACHGKGAYHFIRQAMTVIDIGAQDCKLIHLDARGSRTGFKMNRKCAAGTGAFLEEIAYRLDLSPADLNGLAERSTRESPLGSFCTVFAATEILEKIRAGLLVEDIIKGAFRSVVNRVREMDVVTGTLVMTGGVAAHNPVLVRIVEEAFGQPVLLPPDPQFIGAFGAALFAAEMKENGDL